MTPIPVITEPEALKGVYHALSERFGAQHWWPGDSRLEIMAGAVLTQNAAWSNVEKAIANLKQADCLSLSRLHAMPLEELARLIQPAGYYNVKARRLWNLLDWVVQQGGEPTLCEWSLDDLRSGLLSINGVGPETADDILLYAFERPVFVVDAYTRRILRRMGLLVGEPGYEDLRQALEAALGSEVTTTREQVAVYNEMHALIVILAKQYCRPKPRCEACPLSKQCQRVDV